MRELTIGKTRGLQQLSNPNGIFTICAVDHRRSLRRIIDSENPASVTYQTMMDFKMDICEVLVPRAGAVLLDIYSASRAIASNTISGKTGLLISLEAADYDVHGDDEKFTDFLIDWNVDTVRGMGASAVKTTLYYRPDLPNMASSQLGTVTKLACDCKQTDIALIVGPRNYIVPELERDQWEYARKKPDLMINTVRQLSMLPIDVLKVEFPADISYEQDKDRLLYLCQQLDEACRVPWVLLSGGISFDVFLWQLEIACKAGASGFLAGRGLWQESAGMTSRWERIKFLKHTATERLDQLIVVADSCAKPWHKKLEASNNYDLPDFTADWNQNYSKVHEKVAARQVVTPAMN